VQVGSDVVVFTDTGANNGAYEDAMVLVGRTINDISDTNLVGGSTAMVINGTAAAETISGTAGDDIISAFAGADSITALAGNDTIDAGIGADIIDGGSGNDSIVGNDGADSLVGGSGADTIDGGIGADVIDGGAGADSIVLLAGEADVVNIAAGQSGVSAVGVGLAGADSITGWVAADHSIDFLGFAAGGANYAEGGAPVADYVTAHTAADAALGAGVIYYAAEVTGVGVVLFHDNDANGTFDNGEDAVILVGKGLADISAVDII